MKTLIEWTRAIAVALVFCGIVGGLVELWFRQQGL